LFTTVAFCQNKVKVIEKNIDNFNRTVEEQSDSALYYINKAYSESRALKNDFLTARCLYNFGHYFFTQNNKKKALFYYQKAIPIAIKSKNHKIICKSFIQIGSFAMDEGNYKEALKNYLIVLETAEKENLESFESDVNVKIGILHEIQGDTVKALEHFKRSEYIAKKNNFKEDLLYSYSNIGVLEQKKRPQNAILNLKKSLIIAEELNNLEAKFDILINLNNTFLSIDSKKSINTSFLYLKNAEKVAEALADSTKLFYVNYNYGAHYLKLKKYSKALDHYKIALDLSKNVDEEQKANILWSIANAHKESGNYQKAFEYHEKFHQKNDSLIGLEKTKSFNEIQTKYETEKKNLQINLLTKEAVIEQDKKQKILFGGIALLVGALFFGLFFWNRNRTQKIINQQENELYIQEKKRLEQEQELKRIQGLIDGQNQERNRISREIHDGIGAKLAGIKLELSQVNDSVDNQKLGGIITNFTHVFSEVRTISHNLSSGYINENTLDTLLFELQKEYTNRGEFEVEITIFPEDCLQNIVPEAKHQLYRIIQELFANISKHAQAKNASLTITQHNDVLNLIMEDDGVGFSDSNKNGIGLYNIKERLFLLHGIFTIDDSKQQGSAVIIDIPNANLHTQA
jgi:two-component system, NarL family, sensor kinase